MINKYYVQRYVQPVVVYKNILSIANDDLHLISQTCTESVMGNSTTPQEVLHMSFYVDPIYVPPL